MKPVIAKWITLNSSTRVQHFVTGGPTPRNKVRIACQSRYRSFDLPFKPHKERPLCRRCARRSGAELLRFVKKLVNDRLGLPKGWFGEAGVVPQNG